jgi:hypothetical protein
VSPSLERPSLERPAFVALNSIYIAALSNGAKTESGLSNLNLFLPSLNPIVYEQPA